MRVVPALVVAAACGRSPHGAGQLVDVYAFVGDSEPAAGATVIAHDASGAALDTVMTDAVGHAQPAIENGALITVVFTDGANVALVTTLSPAAGSELDIHGPPPAGAPPTVAGALEVAPTMTIIADHYVLELGCTVSQLSALPASIDVNSRCLGSDSNLDILLLAYQNDQVAGYATGRLDLSSGAATFAPAQWSTTTASVPITLDGVAPLLDWVLLVDGLPFDAQAISGSAPLWNGLAVTAAIVHAGITMPTTAQVTTRYIAGAPTAIDFGPSDFLAPIDVSLVLDTSQGMQLSWAPAPLDADAVDVHLEWTVGGNHVAWDIVLPPDGSDAAFPETAPDLGQLVGPPDATPSALLRYVQAATPAGWDALVANGLYVESATGPSTIASPPASGELLATQATGYAP
jgi:hypothetical protein